MANSLKLVLFELAEHRRTTGMGTRHGYVHEVKEASGERKFRAVVGIKHDGSPMLSPWMSSEEHRGGSRSQQLIEKGQNVLVTTHGGDYRNATASPSSEGNSFPQPQHAPGINGDSTQAGKVRTSMNKPGGSGGNGTHFHDVWIADQDEQLPKHQEQSGKPETGGASGGGQQSGQGGGQQKQAKAAMKQRCDEKGYLTGRVGNDDSAARYAAHKKGAKIRKSESTIWVDEEGCWSSKPIQLKADQIPNDNG